VQAIFLGVFAALCWSVHDLIARRTTERVGPFRVALAVVLTGALLLAPYVYFSDGQLFQDRNEILWPLALGVFYGIGIAGLFLAFSLGPVALVAPLTATYPALVFLWGIVQGLQPSALQLAASAVAIGGSVIVALASSKGEGLSGVVPGKTLLFIGSCIVCCFGYASAVAAGQTAAMYADAATVACVSRLSSALILFPAAASERRQPKLKGFYLWIGVAAMAGLDVLGLLAVVVSGLLPGKEFAAIGISAYGGIAVILSVLILKEKTTPAGWAGISLIVAGIAALALP
jgi:drug/metabolite transporter (DMT)-like permease